MQSSLAFCGDGSTGRQGSQKRGFLRSIVVDSASLWQPLFHIRSLDGSAIAIIPWRDIVSVWHKRVARILPTAGHPWDPANPNPNPNSTVRTQFTLNYLPRIFFRSDEGHSTLSSVWLRHWSGTDQLFSLSVLQIKMNVSDIVVVCVSSRSVLMTICSRTSRRCWSKTCRRPMGRATENLNHTARRQLITGV